MIEQAIATLLITSQAFTNGGIIPQKYTCDGQDINPPLKIEKIPEETKSLAIIVEDPDAPSGTWDHWVVWNIKPDKTLTIKENVIPGIEGMNDFKKRHYGGPCPPSGTHRYYFKIYALDTELDLDSNAGKNELLRAMEGHKLAQGELMGKYSRN